MYRTLIRNLNNDTYDISTLVTSIEYYTDINGQPGSLSFLINKDPKEQVKLVWKDGFPTVGDEVFFSNEDNMIFKGYIFNVGTDHEGIMHITAYDQMRYFSNSDIFVSQPETASDLFKEICSRASIGSNNYSIVNPSSAVLVSKIHNNKTYYAIMEEAFNETLRGEGHRYYLIDRAGILEFNLLGADMSDTIIGENSLLTGYRYEIDIDSQTYNKVIMVKGSEEEGYIKSIVEQDEENIGKYGLLQSVIKASEELDDSMVEQYAKNFLAVYNKPSTALTLSAIGDDSIIAGTSFVFKLPSVGVEGRRMFASSCTHRYKNDVHTMELEVMILPEDQYE